MDSFTEYTGGSWLKRLMGSIKSVAVGVVLFVVAFPVLFWNEGRSLKREQTLLEGRAKVVSVPADAVDAGRDKALVHVSGETATDETLRDSEFNVSAKAIKLERAAQLYQWEEKREKNGDKTTYSYSKVWASGLHDSSQFRQPSGHENPSSLKHTDFSAVAAKVTLGAFQLSAGLVAGLHNWRPLAATEAMAAALPEALRAQAKVYQGGFYLGQDPANPQIGDYKISFKVVEPGPASAVAAQAGNMLEAWRSSNGGTIELIESGAVGAQEMIQHAIEENKVLTWILRGVGCFVMFLGITMVFRPIAVFGGAVPLVGELLEGGIAIFAALVSIGLSLITIAIGWLVYRPLIGAALLAAGLAPLVLLKMMRKGKGAQAPPPIPAPIPPPIPPRG